MSSLAIVRSQRGLIEKSRAAANSVQLPSKLPGTRHC